MQIAIVAILLLAFFSVGGASGSQESLKDERERFYRGIFIPCLRYDYAFRPPVNARPTSLFNCREDDERFCVCYDRLE